MKRRLFHILMAAALLSVATYRAAIATPEPSPTRISWELQLEPTAPARILVDTDQGQRVYWYLLYSVTNNTPQDIDFHPEIVRVSEIASEVPEDQAEAHADKASKLTVEPSLVGVHPKIFAAIKNLHAKTHPFLVEPVKAISKLKQGRDNSLSSVAVFPELDPRVSKFTIYIGGLSGEQMTKSNPLYDAKKPPSDDNQPVFVLRKTLAIPYTLPGDERTRKNAEPALGRMEWVMR
ncbi:MAG: hypothetical protein IPK83_03720 [Planctomycetes bacterium]|nr:hypothetical protein [Planctomycetota bacterium]